MPYTQQQHNLFAAIASDESGELAKKYGIGRSEARVMMGEGIKRDGKKKPKRKVTE